MSLYPDLSDLVEPSKYPLPESDSEEFESYSSMSSEDKNSTVSEDKYPNMKIKAEIDINTLMSTIPEYDGYNMPLTKFRKYCILAMNTAPDDMASIIFSLIMQKLKGKAGKCVAHRYVETMEDLFDILSQNFESDNTISVLLSQLLQTKGNDCKELGNKIASLRDKLIIAVTNEKIKSPAALIEKLAMIKYIDNLPSEVNIITKAKNPTNLDRAIEIATEEERYRRIHSASSFKSRNIKPKPKHEDNSSTDKREKHSSSVGESSKPSVTCDYCKRSGHTRDNCYRKKNKSTEREKQKVQCTTTQEDSYSSDSDDDVNDLNSIIEETEEESLRE